MTGALSPGSTSARTSSMPSAAATACGRAAVVAADQHACARPARAGSRSPRRHWAWAHRRTRAGRARARGRRRAVGQPRDGAAFAAAARPRRARRARRVGAAARASARSLPSRSTRPSTTPPMPRPAIACTSLRGTWRRPRSARPRVEHRARQRMLAARLQRGGELEQHGVVDRRRRRRSATSARPALGERAGLVEGDGARRACASSSACASLIRMPWRAATPVPAMIAVGVARPSAQGQAITSTATALSRPAVHWPASKPQPSKRQQRGDQHHRHEDRAHAVDQRAGSAPCAPAPTRPAATMRASVDLGADRGGAHAAAALRR